MGTGKHGNHMSILTADLYTLISVLRIHYAAPVLALLLAFLWTPRSRAWVESKIGTGACAFISGMISAVLVCIIGILGWHLAGVAATGPVPTADPTALETGPSQLDQALAWAKANFRTRFGLPIYYYVPWLAALLVLVYCAVDRIDVLAESRSKFRKVLFWTVVPGALILAAILSVYNAAPWGFLLSFVLLGGLILLAVWRTVWKDSAVFVKGMSSALFLILAVLSALNYFNFAEWRANDFFNAYEFYHYYIGSKYAPEVGYMGMYEASLVADEETGLMYNNRKGGIRNLTTGRYYSSREEALKRADEVRGWFSEDRWEEFRDDIAFFKAKLKSSRWNGVLRDKGYNATPVWTAIVGGGLSTIVSTDNEQGMYLLAMLDVFLIIAAALCVMWAFGPNAALMMLIVLGTSYVMKYSHMKGAYLRTDFTMSVIIAICLIKKDYYKVAGAFTAYSIMSRVFPAALLFGIGAKFFWDLFPTLWRAPKAWLKEKTTRNGVIASLAGGLLFFLLYAAIPILGIRALAGDTFIAHQSDILLGSVMAAVVLAYFTVTSLWGLYSNTVKRAYMGYFIAVGVTLVVLFSVSIVYAALTPNYDRYAKEMRAQNPDISNGMLRARFLTRYWEEYGLKIGRHNEDISPWRVGFKYLFINQWRQGDSPWTQAYNYVDKNGVAAGWEALHADNKTPRENIESAIKSNAPFTRSIRWKKVDEATLAPGQEVYRYKGFTLYEWRWIIPLSVLALSLFLMIGLKDYEAFAFSFVVVYFLASATYYYYIMLLIPLLFFTPNIGRPSRAIGAAMIIFFAMPGYYLYSQMSWQQQFPTYYYHSLMYGILCVYMMFCAGGDTLATLGGRVRRLAAPGSPGTPPNEFTDAPDEPQDIPPPPRFHGGAATAAETLPEISNLLERLEDTPIATDSESDAGESRPIDAIESTPIVTNDEDESYEPPVDQPLDTMESAPPFELPEVEIPVAEPDADETASADAAVEPDRSTTDTEPTDIESTGETPEDEDTPPADDEAADEDPPLERL